MGVNKEGRRGAWSRRLEWYMVQNVMDFQEPNTETGSKMSQRLESETIAKVRIWHSRQRRKGAIKSLYYK